MMNRIYASDCQMTQKRKYYQVQRRLFNGT